MEFLINGQKRQIKEFLSAMKGTLVMDDEDMDKMMPTYKFTSSSHIGGMI